jgi:hypothetical protein
MMHSHNDACGIRATEATMITKDVASVLKGLAQRHLEASCEKPISHNIFEGQATSSSMTTKLTLLSSWRTTALRAKWAE